MITTHTSYNAQTKNLGGIMEAKNDMKKKAGRPKGDKKGAKGGVPKPVIGGMDTLGALPVGGMSKKKAMPASKGKKAPVGKKKK